MERKDLTLDYWRSTVDTLLTTHGKDLLHGKGSISNTEMEQVVNAVYEQFDARRKAYDAMLADEEDTKLLEEIIEKTKEL